MTELLVAFVTAIASVLATRGWPTLARRVKEHAAMLKDVPSDLGADMKALLAMELAQLVAQEASRLDRTINTLLNVQRGAWLATAVSTVVWLWIFNIPANELTRLVAIFALVAFPTSVVALIVALVAGGMVRKRRRAATKHRPLSQVADNVG